MSAAVVVLGAALGAALAALGPLPTLLGLSTGEIMRGMPACQVVSGDPPKVACRLDGLGAAQRAVFLFDDAQRAVSVAVDIPPQASLQAAEQAVRPLVRLIEASRGAPQVRRSEAVVEWVFSRRSFVGLVRLSRKGAGWEVQTVMSDPSYRPVVVSRPGARGH